MVIPHFIGLHSYYSLGGGAFFFFNRLKVCGNLCQTSLSASFSNSICSLHVSVTYFGNSQNIFIIIIFLIVICDQ